MQDIEELQKQASDASLLRVSTHTVGIINSIRTVGFDPITQRRGDGEEAGTGCAGRWGDHHFILTASHVLHSGAKPSDLRLFWRPSGAIERIADADLKPKDIANGVPIRDPHAVIHHCAWEDLAVIVIDPTEAGQYTEFADIQNNWIDPAEKEIVHCCGFPIDKHILVGSRWIGNKEERDIAIRPDFFSGEVYFKPNFLSDDYDLIDTTLCHITIPSIRRASAALPRGGKVTSTSWSGSQTLSLPGHVPRATKTALLSRSSRHQ